MNESNRSSTTSSKHLLSSDALARAVFPAAVAHGGPTRKGHGNGWKLHAVVFGTLSLAVMAMLAFTFVVVAGGRM